MRKNMMLLILLAAAALVGLSACGYYARVITHQAHVETPTQQWEYVCYWEGKCNDYTGCSKGDSLVKLCNINPDNTVVCADQTAANTLLNPHRK